MGRLEIEIVEEQEHVEGSIIRGRERAKKNSYSTDLSSCWALVRERNSENNTVSIEIIKTGVIVKNVEVRSLEWAGANTIGFGERDLPPVNSKVLVLFPEGIIENAIVICSVLSQIGDVNLKQSEELMVAGKENVILRIKEDGFKVSYDKDTGEWEVADASGNVIQGSSTGVLINGNLEILI